MGALFYFGRTQAMGADQSPLSTSALELVQTSESVFQKNFDSPNSLAECFQKLDFAVAESMSIDVNTAFELSKRHLVEEVFLKHLTVVEAATYLVQLDSKRTEFFQKMAYFRTTKDAQRFDAFKSFCNSYESINLRVKRSRWIETAPPSSLCDCVGQPGTNHDSDNVKCMTRQAQVQFCETLPKIFQEAEHAHTESAEKAEEGVIASENVAKNSRLTRNTCEQLFK